MNIYGLSFEVQKNEIEKLCFDKCGKIVIGSINFDNHNFLTCFEKKCQYQEKKLDTKFKIDIGENLIIRKLKRS